MLLATIGCASYRSALLKTPHAGSFVQNAQPHTPAQRIVASAHQQVVVGATYNAAYQRISFPNGDVPANQGACTDVVIRALRAAGYDLQSLMHADIKRHFASYPRREAHPDTNIDQRRVPNQMFFFRRFGQTLSRRTDAKHRAAWRPGDFVFWKLPSGLDHVGIVSDNLDSDGWPLVIHNMNRCMEEDVLRAWPIQGHYRYPKA